MKRLSMFLSLVRTWCEHRKVLLYSIAGCAIVTGVLIIAWPMDVHRYLSVSPSPEMQDRSGRLMYGFLNQEENWCFARNLERISPRLIDATIATEDQRFYSHPGVDPLAVIRAAWQDVIGGRIISGASTLAMQVVKLTYRQSGTLCGKLFQAVEALRLQTRVGRKDILWAYLNKAPYGGNLVGCEAAARRYFGKPAKELALPEAALLAGLPKSPSLYSPLKHSKRALARRNYVLRRMWEEGFITEAERQEATKQPLGVRKWTFPKIAPHLAMKLRGEVTKRGRLRTTLDTHIQKMTERFVKAAVRASGGAIENGAAVVVDVKTAQVLARAGSADFWKTPGGGQVDLCLAPRSPGSTLKPFTYALAMENNCLYSSETLLDDTWDYGLYHPENFDLKYNGLISASYALRGSLNVPAVTVLQRVGVSAVQTLLKHIGVTTLTKPAEYYGLGLTLGSCEMRLQELTAAYCMLANLGEYRPLMIQMGKPAPASERAFSRGICLKLYEMLEQPLPSELGHDTPPAVNTPPRVCWKTGTSWGLRDAWAFIFNRHYVVGVWMGNNDGHSSSALVGATAALPVAGKIFRSLPPKNVPAWPETGGDLREVTVCALSGLPASPWCPHTRKVFLPRNQYLNRICDMHYPAPKPGRGENAIRTVVERWPASAQGWDLAHIQSPISPNFDDQSKRTSRLEDLRILEPTDRSEYVLTGEPNSDRIRLRTSVGAEIPLHWYLDDRFLGDSYPNQPLFVKLDAGSHRLTCMTPSGKTSTAQYRVLHPEGIPLAGAE